MTGITHLFTSVLNMSITATYVVLAVIVLRFFLKRLPKIFSYCLWLPVFLRLALPFSISTSLSFFSVLNNTKQAGTGVIKHIPQNIIYSPVANSGINNAVPVALSNTAINPMQLALDIAGIVWVAGIAVLLVYSIISYIKVLKKIKTATLVKDNIFETDRINTPFVCGLLIPKIYIPSGIGANELSYVLEHERTHIGRLDHIIKLFAFLVLIFHWFNPFAWLSFILMSKDMEMSCDESVIKKLGQDIKTGYSSSLLSLSAKRSGLLTGSPLAFGESNIKSRIKNILTYKKPAFWVTVVVIMLTTAFITGFSTNPSGIKLPAASSYHGYNTEALIAGKTPYVGNASKVTALLDDIQLPKGIVRGGIELQTDKPPYALTIHLKAKDASSITVNGAISGEAFHRNAIVLFSVIDNVDVINYKVSDKAVNYDGTSFSYTEGGVEYGFTFKRDEAERVTGGDVRKYAANIDSIKKLIDKVNNMLPDTAEKKEEEQIEKNIAVIISSPVQSSNPEDYIKKHSREYEDILKMGDTALNYLLGQFGKGNNNDLRGQIMMRLCKDLLGDRNNVTEEGLSPQQWYSKLTISKEIRLPDFRSDSSDLTEQLVYAAAVKKYSWTDDGFTVVAPTIFKTVQSGSKLKVIATVYSSRYKLYGKTLSERGGSIVPAIITFIRDTDGNYVLSEYTEAEDGSYWLPSIKGFTKGLTDQEGKKLYNTIIEDYASNQKRSELLRKNLIKHLKANNQKGVTLKLNNGESYLLT
jgi:beta-lactamase regulating signal transducer with metallopeptidase domain